MSELKHGYTTGTCAAAAAKAAAALLAGEEQADPIQVCVTLPDGETVCLPLAFARLDGDRATAAVQKDAGDDPDVTHGSLVVATVAWRDDDRIEFTAGEGVGTVTRPGLSIPPGQPAINPTPRRMIRQAVREVTARGVQVQIAIPGGRELAQKTFNPRLGIQGGLSILGNSGRVRPFSHAAVQATVGCAMDVAAAGAVMFPVLVPGRIGEKAARKHFKLAPEQIVEVSNEWGYALSRLHAYAFERVLIVGHPGKLAKLADGQWQTHSARSPNPVAILARFGMDLLGRRLAEDSSTTEALMNSLDLCERSRLANALAEKIARAATAKIGGSPVAAVFLVNLQGNKFGSFGDLSPWGK
ncbi:MAG: cobalamin biosynthesis protein CbiD [Desulfobacteraceae bacterium]|nr:MAG: cobalamin biosynthesis protein CbiD [Desulfobacteraceae bacterium]